jgi:hypothetical protein
LPQAWLALMPPYDLVRRLETFGAALQAGEPYAFEHRLAGRPDDEWHLTQAVPVRAGSEPVWLGATVRRPEPSPPGVLLPRLGGLRLAVLADPGGAASGAWYDAFSLPDGRLALSVGAVPQARELGERGPGDPAALLRTAIRGAALAGAAPDLVLAAADAALSGAEPARAASALVALYDPRTGLLDHAGAGNPPPRLCDLTAEAAPDALARPPLGRPARLEAEVRTAALRPGSALLLHAGGPLGAGAVILLLSRDLDAAGQAW